MHAETVAPIILTLEKESKMTFRIVAGKRARTNVQKMLGSDAADLICGGLPFSYGMFAEGGFLPYFDRFVRITTKILPYGRESGFALV